MQTWPLPKLYQELDSLVDFLPWGSSGGYQPLTSFQVSDPGKKPYNKLKKQIKIHQKKLSLPKALKERHTSICKIIQTKPTLIQTRLIDNSLCCEPIHLLLVNLNIIWSVILICLPFHLPFVAVDCGNSPSVPQWIQPNGKNSTLTKIAEHLHLYWCTEPFNYHLYHISRWLIFNHKILFRTKNIHVYIFLFNERKYLPVFWIVCIINKIKFHFTTVNINVHILCLMKGSIFPVFWILCIINKIM